MKPFKKLFAFALTFPLMLIIGVGAYIACAFGRVIGCMVMSLEDFVAIVDAFIEAYLDLFDRIDKGYPLFGGNPER